MLKKPPIAQYTKIENLVIKLRKENKIIKFDKNNIEW